MYQIGDCNYLDFAEIEKAVKLINVFKTIKNDKTI